MLQNCQFFEQGTAYAMTADEPDHPHAGRAIITAPEEPLATGPDIARAVRFASPTAIAPASWAAANGPAWTGVAGTYTGPGGLPEGEWRIPTGYGRERPEGPSKGQLHIRAEMLRIEREWAARSRDMLDAAEARAGHSPDCHSRR